MKDNRKTIQVLMILTLIFTIMGGSLAYWSWNSSTSTTVNFTLSGSNTAGFSCSADGGVAGIAVLAGVLGFGCNRGLGNVYFSWRSVLAGEIG